MAACLREAGLRSAASLRHNKTGNYAQSSQQPYFPPYIKNEINPFQSSCSIAMKDITAALKDAVDTDVADKEGNYVERFNAEISSDKPADSPFSLVNGKTHLAGTVVRTKEYLEALVTRLRESHLLS